VIKINLQKLLSLTLGCLAATHFATPRPLSAASPAFSSASKPAVAWSAGNLKINGTDHSGSANVFPGQSIETGRAASQLYLADGSRLRLGASSRLAVKANSLDLSSGVARIDSVAPGQTVLPIHAGGLEIRGRDGIVSRPSTSDVLVSARANPIEVRRHDGILIAMVRPGQTLSFAFGQASAKVTELNGTIVKENGKYFVTDEVTKIKVELAGKDAAPWEGKQVRLKGEMAKTANNQITFTVNEVIVVNPAAAGAAAGAASGLSSKVVIMGIVVASGASGAAALALVDGNQDQNISQ
jgi:hypothetical protein